MVKMKRQQNLGEDDPEQNNRIKCKPEATTTLTITALVMDNLNTHTGASLYKAFAPEEARRILNKLEIHYTPKHDSWLNMAEIELSILSRQCLDRRIPDQNALKREVAAWQEKRNAIARPMEWRFTNENARVKLKKLYPTLQE
jgi:hypothetical protein